jgi:hypothetical protein
MAGGLGWLAGWLALRADPSPSVPLPQGEREVLRVLLCVEPAWFEADIAD